MSDWTNMKMPVVTGILAKVQPPKNEKIKLTETNGGDDMLLLPMVANYYDPQSQEQEAFWFKCGFTGDTATRHYDNLKAGDVVFVDFRGNFPQLSTADDSEYINTTIWFPNLLYAKWGKDNDDDGGGSDRKRDKKSGGRGKKRDKKSGGKGKSQNGSGRGRRRRRQSDYFEDDD